MLQVVFLCGRFEVTVLQVCVLSMRSHQVFDQVEAPCVPYPEPVPPVTAAANCNFVLGVHCEKLEDRIT